MGSARKNTREDASEDILEGTRGAAARRRKGLIPPGLAAAGAGVLLSIAVAACGASGNPDGNAPVSTSPAASAGSSVPIGGDSVPPASATGSAAIPSTPSLSGPPTESQSPSPPSGCTPTPAPASPAPSGEVPTSPDASADCPSTPASAGS